jgi:two-component system, sensor histidine kinase PdtaS
MKIYRKWKSWLIGDYIATRPDNYDHAKAELLFNATFLVYLILVPTAVYTFACGLYGKAIPTLAGLCFVTIQLVIFRKLSSTWWSSLFICSVTSALICININFNTAEIHLAEPFWMIVIVVFAVFMMGVKWGIFFCSVLMTGFVFFVVGKLEDNLKTVLESIGTTRYFLVAEITAALFTLIYILSMFVITTKRSERALLKLNNDLGVQNHLVNKQNAEITVLLKEIHHRVKNNLQVITSLLRLQSTLIKDRASRKVFEDAQYRVQAIALIHQRMYQSAELSDIDPNVYFRELAHDLLRQHVTTQSVTLHAEIDLPDWQQDIVVPLGLLLNELIANSVEHGDLGASGRIVIRLVKRKENVELHYSDNGNGFAQDHEPGFGLELIETLCAQLNGELELQNMPGKGVKYGFVLGRVEAAVM